MGFDHRTLVELRTYTLYPGTRSTFVELFEGQFVDSQRAAGIQLLGWFVDRDRDDRFVWLRAFPDWESRAIALETFYTGAHWREHGPRANQMMVDSDNVRLLRAVPGYPAMMPTDDADALSSGPAGLDGESATVLVQPVRLNGAARSETPTSAVVTTEDRPVLLLETAMVANNFERLPVIPDPCLVAVAHGSGDTTLRLADCLLRQAAAQRRVVCVGDPTTLRLARAPRSPLPRMP